MRTLNGERVAFIEKTPRVLHPVTKEWIYGPKGAGGQYPAQPEIYGYYPPSREWADLKLMELYGTMTYNLTLPDGYTPRPLPGRDEWTAALLSGKYQQGIESLCLTEGATPQYCCLGVLCRVQNRPSKARVKDVEFDGMALRLAGQNPLYPVLLGTGHFPADVKVIVEGNTETFKSLAGCNDAGLTFVQIVEIINQVWSNAPKNW